MATETGKLNLQDISAGVEPTNAATIVSLTDSSGGTAADTIAAIGATYDQAEVRNAVASLAAKVNAMLTLLQNMGFRN